MKLVLVLLLMASALISCSSGQAIGPFELLFDCSEIHGRDNSSPSGVYTIDPKAFSTKQVYCDMESFGGRWTVFQRRVDGTLQFFRPWDSYKWGFGDAAGEYWLGLESIHQLTRQGKHELLVAMEDFEGNTASARYSSFSVGSERFGYTLFVSGFTDGGAGDALSYHNGMKFSTLDKDQDTDPSRNCAKVFLGAFWYKSCHHTNPNGLYLSGADDTRFAVGVEWFQWKGRNYSLKTISMMIRPVQ